MSPSDDSDAPSAPGPRLSRAARQLEAARARRDALFAERAQSRPLADVKPWEAGEARDDTPVPGLLDEAALPELVSEAPPEPSRDPVVPEPAAADALPAPLLPIGIMSDVAPVSGPDPETRVQQADPAPVLREAEPAPEAAATGAPLEAGPVAEDPAPLPESAVAAAPVEVPLLLIADPADDASPPPSGEAAVTVAPVEPEPLPATDPVAASETAPVLAPDPGPSTEAGNLAPVMARDAEPAAEERDAPPPSAGPRAMAAAALSVRAAALRWGAAALAAATSAASAASATARRLSATVGAVRMPATAPSPGPARAVVLLGLCAFALLAAASRLDLWPGRGAMPPVAVILAPDHAAPPAVASVAATPRVTPDRAVARAPHPAPLSHPAGRPADPHPGLLPAEATLLPQPTAPQGSVLAGGVPETAVWAGAELLQVQTLAAPPVLSTPQRPAPGARAAPAFVVAPVPEASAVRILGTWTGPVPRLRVFLPDRRVEGLETVLETLGALGLEPETTGQVGYTVRTTHVRYYHPADGEAAAQLADAVGGEMRDFTDARPKPPAGTLELWIAGLAQPRPPEEEGRPLLLHEMVARFFRNQAARNATAGTRP